MKSTGVAGVRVVAQLVLVVSSTLGVAQEAKSATGKIARLSEYRGRVVLLDFWATTCGGCIQEISMFIEVAKAYERRGLTTIGVSEDIAFAGPKYSHWSDLEQLPDLPENYRNWTFRIESRNPGVVLSVTEDNIPDETKRAVPMNSGRACYQSSRGSSRPGPEAWPPGALDSSDA